MRSRSRAIYLVAGAVVLVTLPLAFSSLDRSGAAPAIFSDIAMPAMAKANVDSLGACWGDYDGDGDQDLFVANFGAREGWASDLWRNDGAGKFTDVAAQAGVTSPSLESAVACAFIDINHDGHLDLFISSKSNKGKGASSQESKLYKNNGDGTFTDITATAGMRLAGIGANAVDWADYDRDGDYDAFIGTRGDEAPNYFFEQTAPLVFKDVAAAKGLADPVGPSYTFLGSWFDYDGDGDPDLLLATDWWGVEFFRNDGGIFTRVTTTAFPPATDGTPGTPPNNPMGVTWGDYDNDGCMDVFISGMNIPGQGGFDETAFTADSPSRLYRSNCNGTFTDASKDARLIPTGLVEWSANFVDFDNDGDLDLSVVAGNATDRTPPNLGRPRGATRRLISLVAYVARKFVPSSVVAWAYRYEIMLPASGPTGRAAAMPSLLYKNMRVETGEATFVDVTDQMGVANLSAGRGSAWADFDNDGALDWFVPGRGTPNRLFHNNGPVGHYLRVHLVGDPFRDAVGAWVKIKTATNSQIRHVHVLDGYLSQSQMDPHFGLGKVGTVDEIWVRWPGTTAWMLACSAVPANVKVTITQGGGCLW